jgi:CheY-like chemotaxis protein
MRPRSDGAAAHLPWLRRYARVLTGSARLGDDVAESSLRAMRANPRAENEFARVALFRTFSRLFNAHARADGPGQTNGGPISLASPLSAQTFLLQELEELSPEEAARILGVAVPRLRELTEAGAHAIHLESGHEVLILDIEPLITLEISSALEEFGYRIAGTPRTAEAASALTRSEQPDVIILTSAIRFDVSAAPLTLAENLQRICNSSLVLMTGYPQRFLCGQEGEWAFIIAKPVRAAAVAAVVSQALRFRREMPRQSPWGCG